jgi:hypothetical protein
MDERVSHVMVRFDLMTDDGPNSYAYMVMGRIVYNFTPSASVFKIKAWRFGLIFVLLDVVAFLIQLAGLASVGAAKQPSKATSGIHICKFTI